MSQAIKCDICGTVFPQSEYKTITSIVEMDMMDKIYTRIDCCSECAKYLRSCMMKALKEKTPTCRELWDLEHDPLKGPICCPFVYGYVSKESCCCDGSHGNETKCAACWDQPATRKE